MKTLVNKHIAVLIDESTDTAVFVRREPKYTDDGLIDVLSDYTLDYDHDCKLESDGWCECAPDADLDDWYEGEDEVIF